MPLIKCPSCSADLADRSRFCSSCGVSVSSFTQLPTVVDSRSGLRSRGPVSSGSFGLGLFPPGTILGERYRIIGLLGRGGMGEVYRADDLKLSQPVALKFLAEAIASDASWLERFYSEVRLARQVSHPNVCRVYDVGEIDGRHYLSMEYVDGEDLASLLRRIGKLGRDKALDIARQLCAGLAAAHDKGVLHRDLKPANVMLDGRGRVRITDFGLAAGADQASREGEVSGTPAYMSPEQLEGRPVTVRSDLYSLGLLLFELYTGKRVFEADSLDEWRQAHSSRIPDSPSIFTREMDPIVEKVILRCLEKDARERPASALAVAAALPGGDPLAAALAMGETPSPEMVAAAGKVGGLGTMTGWMCLTTAFLGIVLSVWLSPRSSILSFAPLEKPPEALAERARQVIKKAGYTGRPLDSAYGVLADSDYLRWVEVNDASPSRWEDMRDGRPAGVHFWYRESPRYMIPRDFVPAEGGDDVGHVSPHDPPPLVSGMTFVSLDPLGRLLRLEVVPPQVESGEADAPAPDWTTMFAEAGLDEASFTPTKPQRLPAGFADARMAWIESNPERPDRPMRIEAAAYKGKPVSFELLGPWSRSDRMHEASRTTRQKASEMILVGLLLTVVVGGMVVARRNIKMGRGDRRGAFRIGLFILLSLLLPDALFGKHVPAMSQIGLLVMAASWALFYGAMTWLTYLALEPFVRRWWPDTIISWSRLIAGRVTDPLVGRDILVGAMVGTLTSAISLLEPVVRGWVEGAPPMPQVLVFPNLLGFHRTIYGLMVLPAAVTLTTILLFFLLFLARLALRKDWLAVVACCLLIVTSSTLQGGWVAALFAIPVLVAYFIVLLRFGLVALASVALFGRMLLFFPMTIDPSAWYVGQSILVLVVIVALAIYAFKISLAGRPAFGGAGLDD